MNEQVAPLWEILALNTRLFRNSLADVDDEAAQSRPGSGTNNMTFIAVHLLDARAWLARYLGLEYHHPFEAELASVSSVDEVERFPPLESIITAWDEVSARLGEHLRSVADEDIGRESELEFPVGDRSVLGGMAFLLQHESFHIGQLALLRRILGFSPMSYTESDTT
ncbi:MAG: DinB family protein [Gemmatimonadales bacterium]|jgi:uncharacterized damage-inducible protein DinB